MIFTSRLQPAVLIRRYKRFLADVQLPSGELITVHCPNTGSMKNCINEGSACWLLVSNNSNRKYPYTLELITTPTEHLAWIHSQKANALVAEALCNGRIAELVGYANIQTEVKYGDASRIDFLLTKEEAECFVEVKSVTLLDDTLPLATNKNAISLLGVGCFPDAVSLRGQKHLRELIAVTQRGQRAVLLFCVMHNGINAVAAARHIDSDYAALLKKAQAAGVELLVYRAAISLDKVRLSERLPFIPNEHTEI